MTGKYRKGDPYGTHRVKSPKGALPQAAWELDNDFSKMADNEVLCQVDVLNVDSASFTDLKDHSGGDPANLGRMITGIVKQRGKLQNPRTGSGGMFIGSVLEVAPKLNGKAGLSPGDRIASLVSLTLTPLRVERIKDIHMEKDQVEIEGQAVLFESGVWARIPDDIPERLALAVLDVAGAAAQVDRLVAEGDTVAVLGARGKSGLLCCYQAKQRAGKKGKVIAVVHSRKGIADVKNAPFVDEVVVAPADDPMDLYRKIRKTTEGELCHVVVSCVSRPDCEMGAIMIARNWGKVYFFSMATSFTKAALGAEGIGKDVDLIIGNGFCQGHAGLTLDIMRHSGYLRKLFDKRYG